MTTPSESPDGRTLSTTYQPEEIEARWYARWEEAGYFEADPASGKDPFTIVLPPPNVTGALHIGHALGHTLMDALTRRARMQGEEALWLPGTDHAGIATQNVVERELAKEGTDRHELGREAFVERVWEWKHHYGGRILDQMRKLGDSCDWSRERFTMDEGLSRAVRTVFVRWFDDGLIYRGNRIINWCPRCGTALSDIEVEHEDVDGELITFRYQLRNVPMQVAEQSFKVGNVEFPAGSFIITGAANLAAARAAVEQLGPVSGLVLSHCESVDSGFLDTTVESFDRHYAVNVRAPVLLSCELARRHATRWLETRDTWNPSTRAYAGSVLNPANYELARPGASPGSSSAATRATTPTRCCRSTALWLRAPRNRGHPVPRARAPGRPAGRSCPPRSSS